MTQTLLIEYWKPHVSLHKIKKTLTEIFGYDIAYHIYNFMTDHKTVSCNFDKGRKQFEIECDIPAGITIFIPQKASSTLSESFYKFEFLVNLSVSALKLNFVFLSLSNHYRLESVCVKVGRTLFRMSRLLRSLNHSINFKIGTWLCIDGARINFCGREFTFGFLMCNFVKLLTCLPRDVKRVSKRH